MSIIAYSLCLITELYMVYKLKKIGKRIFFLTPYNIDIDKLNVQKEEAIVELLIINYTQIAVAVLTTIMLEIISLMNKWAQNVSIALAVLLVTVVIVLFFITKKKHKSTLTNM